MQMVMHSYVFSKQSGIQDVKTKKEITNNFLKGLAAAVTCDPLTPERYSINLKNIIMLLNCSKMNASKAH